MRLAIVEFPGSHGIKELEYALTDIMGYTCERVWHQIDNLGSPDFVIIPGGAAFGDILRPGALCQSSRIAPELRRLANHGTPMLGIGNGFQILCEIEALCGSFLPNADNSFLNLLVNLKLVSSDCMLTRELKSEQILKLPLACYCGRFYADARTLVDLEENHQIVFKFCDEDGDIYDNPTFNGSTKSIAAITNRKKNVLGMIAHPERAVDEHFSNTDGINLLKSALNVVI